MGRQPLVSVIIPVYNAESFLRECLDSAVNQTLSDIEIICVNDGSKDSSLTILEEYASRDERIKIIDKPNAGYGHTMNRGLDLATGEYVAFLESDDCIELTAYERLYGLAEKDNLDIIKGEYYTLVGFGPNRILERVSLTKIKERYWKKFRPLDEQWSFYMPMMNCLGLLKREMLESNHIRHNETPGAAHQDMGFWFQTLCCADSMMFVDEPFYMYRQDNVNSSMKNDKTTFSTRDEYNYIWQFLQEKPRLMNEAKGVFFHRKYGSCMFSYGNSELSLKLPFIRAIAEEFRNDFASGDFAFEHFDERQKEQLTQIMGSPDEFYLESLGGASVDAIRALQQEAATLRMKLDVALRRESASPVITECADASSDIAISVIIPVYNSAEYLGECLDSVLSQGVPNVEVICVNDGSTDDSARILNEYAQRDSRVRVLTQENQGQGAARNLALEVARGRYVQFVDSDDRLADNAHVSLMEYINAENLDMLLFDGDSFYESAELESTYPTFKVNYRRSKSHDTMRGAELFVALKNENAYRVSPCLALFSTAFLKGNGIYFPEGIIYEDNAFYAKAICSAETARHVNEAYYLRRIREGSTMTSEITAKNALSYFEVYLTMLRFALDEPRDYASARALADEMWIIQRQVVNMYTGLSDAQKAVVRSLPPAKLSLLDNIVARIEESKKRQSAENKMKRMSKSRAWKIGRYVTYPIRALKRVLK